MLHALTTRIVSDASRRYLSFGDASAASRLPSPCVAKNYLLYLHIPFCEVLCPFCSFHRVQFQRERAQKYFAAIRREVQHATECGYHFGELYVGGGTPTVLPDELVATIQLIRELHPVTRISVETNPDDLDGEHLNNLLDVGVSRLSVGVQSFDDQLLREMQRFDKYGSGAKIRQRLNAAQGKFATLNVDLIFNFPRQSEASLRRDLGILTQEIGADQVSFYPLMSTGTSVKSMRKALGTVNYDRESKYYEMIAAHMLAAGYQRSSAWCFSRSSSMIDEYITQQDQYLGLGSGAFSFLGDSFYASTFSINHYLKLIAAGGSGIVRRRQVSRVDHMRYFLMMRLFSGVLDLDDAESMFDGLFRRTLRAELLGLRLLGATTNSAHSIRLTERGYYLWIMMMREFFTGVNRLRDEMRLQIRDEQESFPALAAK